MVFIPITDFAPDLPTLGSPGLEVYNAIPLTSKSWGPFPDLSVITGALTARCQGAISVRASDGTIHNFAGDATKLYKLNADGVTWDNVSKTATTYATPADGRWYFVQMGDRIIATNYADAIQTFLIGTDTLFSDLSATAPKARYIAVIKGTLVASDTFDGTDGYKHNRVWWADFSDPTNWPTPGTAAAAAAQSDFQDIQSGGKIYGIIGGCGGRDGVVFLQNAIVTMDYVGGGVVFSFQDAERGRGTTLSNSIINVGSFAGYIGEDGFNLFDGARSIPIGAEKVDRFFRDTHPESIFAGTQFSATSPDRICTAYDAKKKLIFWAYPTSGSGSNPNVTLIYNWTLQKWSFATLSVEFIYTGFTPGYTLDTLDNVSSSLDALPYSLDSEAWMGGRPILAGFNTSHKFGFFNGDNLVATVFTGDFPNDGRRIFIRGVRPVTDAPTTIVLLYTRDTQDDTSPTITTQSTQDTDEVHHFRVSTKYARVALQIAAATTWYHIQGVDVDFVREGLR